MPNAHESKKIINDLNPSNFYNTYQQVVKDMVEQEQWTVEEKEAMQLLLERDRSPSTRERVSLDDASNKKIADLYFLILLNTLIRSKAQLPFKLPKEELTAWSDDYPRNKFVSNLETYKKKLNQSPLGQEIIKTAAEYAYLYENTSGKEVSEIKARSQSLTDSDENSIGVGDSLAFLWGVANGLMDGSMHYGSFYTPTSNAAALGYGLGFFATAVVELGSLASSLHM
ncbi:Uncharacterised protein [Legionella busanensis]|uniref:Uncharacterized protein n=1 Tax=Legionella busanensis TaxID=190655 RepID=A0A378JUE1_9GAMM|nr:hypothetical protein [Legionella busanensis]STX51822.1 Uncharacterised protein [Legionella busanensis]